MANDGLGGEKGPAEVTDLVLGPELGLRGPGDDQLVRGWLAFVGVAVEDAEASEALLG
ncbi:MAG: hypothetical protein RLZZ124_1043 [Cyanobacteriota bacterium]